MVGFTALSSSSAHSGLSTMTAPSLVGKWKLVRDGSDFMPGLDELKCSPIALKLLGRAETEFIKIEKRKFFDKDEVCLTYVTKSLSVSNSYQLGTLNIESLPGPGIVYGIIQNCNDKFTEFTIHRLGPRCGQMSREVYEFDPVSNEIKLEIEVNSGDGVHVKLIKYLSRFDASHNTNDVQFTTAAVTRGWGRYDYWPASALGDCKVQIVKAAKILTCSRKVPQDSKVQEVLWTRAGFADDFKVDLSSLARRQSLVTKDSTEVIIFCVQVSMNGLTWYVAHRYTEFLLLKSFFLGQNPTTPELKALPTMFPGKAVGLAYRRTVLGRRVEGLGAFLTYFLQNAQFCRQTSVDVICGFLEIPEHLSVQMQRTPDGTPIKSHVSPRSVPSPAGGAAVSAGGRPLPPVPGAAKGTAGGPVLFSSSSTGSMSDASPAAQALFTLLGKKGMAVIKHGRQGAPKARFLRSSPDGTLLYWGGDKNANDKSVFLDEVREIRLGLDIDPATPAHLLPSKAAGQAAADRAKRGLSRSKSGILYGSETLRRNCKMEELALSFSLILPTRTFDIQCKSQQDHDQLLQALRDVCEPSIRAAAAAAATSAGQQTLI